jgi:hypothetical protein
MEKERRGKKRKNEWKGKERKRKKEEHLSARGVKGTSSGCWSAGWRYSGCAPSSSRVLPCNTIMMVHYIYVS